MKKARISEFRLLALAILILIISYYFDNRVSFFFKGIDSFVLKTIFSIAANIGIIFVLVIALPSILLYKRSKRLARLLWLTAFVSFILAFILKIIILRQRPENVLTFPFTHIIDYSFPSMHAMIVFSILPLLVEAFSRYKYLWITFAFAAAFSRIYFRFHFLSDVVFGAFAGYFIGDWLLYLHKRGKLWK